MMRVFKWGFEIKIPETSDFEIDKEDNQLCEHFGTFFFSFCKRNYKHKDTWYIWKYDGCKRLSIFFRGYRVMTGFDHAWKHYKI